jgi:hypothetical protein
VDVMGIFIRLGRRTSTPVVAQNYRFHKLGKLTADRPPDRRCHPAPNRSAINQAIWVASGRQLSRLIGVSVGSGGTRSGAANQMALLCCPAIRNRRMSDRLFNSSCQEILGELAAKAIQNDKNRFYFAVLHKPICRIFSFQTS